MNLSIEGIRNSTHPIFSTKCIAVKQSNDSVLEELFNSENLDEASIKEIKDDDCGYITEDEWKDEISDLEDKDILEIKMNISLGEDNLPFALKVTPNIY